MQLPLVRMGRKIDFSRPSVETRWSPLTPEHGFPSLLFCCFGTDYGRSPASAPGFFRMPIPPSPFLESGNKKTEAWARLRLHPSCSLRWHYPNQVVGRSICFLSAFRLPCFLSHHSIAANDCQEASKVVAFPNLCAYNIEKPINGESADSRAERELNGSDPYLIWIMPT